MTFKVKVERVDDTCPFKNDLIEFSMDKGECLWLRGDSGSGKTSIANDLAGLNPLRGAKTRVTWQEDLDPEVRPVGIVFQQGVLVDSLNLRENLILSCELAGKDSSEKAITEILERVGLDKQDGLKMPNELSGGMLRRAALSMVFAQEKKVIILDEPFVGLDSKAAEGVSHAIDQLKKQGVRFILITHQSEFAQPIVTPKKEVVLENKEVKKSQAHKVRVARTSIFVRTTAKLIDYLGISIPLIICAFFAAGFATSMLFAQMLKETDVNTIMSQLHSDHTSLLFKIFGKEFAKVAAKYLPMIKDKIYVMTMARGFVVELGPLLTALLLAGRIGGSYAGEVGMMQATDQNNLLITLGENPRKWTLLPSSIAAFIAAPILTIIGTYVGLWAGGIVGVSKKYAFFPTIEPYWQGIHDNTFISAPLISYPPFANFYRSIGFMAIILIIGELAGRIKKNLQPRDVPRCITWSVVLASLCVILADWFFSQIYHS